MPEQIAKRLHDYIQQEDLTLGTVSSDLLFDGPGVDQELEED